MTYNKVKSHLKAGVQALSRRCVSSALSSYSKITGPVTTEPYPGPSLGTPVLRKC